MKDFFQQKQTKILNIFFTAGYPYLNATEDILLSLEKNGCDMVEIGIPFSDPLADGPTIQNSSTIALKNGMTIQILFTQLQKVRSQIFMPMVLMGYLNPVLQFDIEKFLKKCQELKISATIFPDMTVEIYEKEYKALYEKYGINNVFLISPETEEKRIRKIDALSNAFIYVVSSNSTTGKKTKLTEQSRFFKKIKALKLKNPFLIGFGIQDKQDFNLVSQYANGAIIGSSFIKAIENKKSKKTLIEASSQFVKQFL